MAAVDDLSLAADFPQATREQWLKRVEGVLRGADPRKSLIARTHNGIEIQPLYPKAGGSAPIAREQVGRWRVSQRVDHSDPEQANELALLDLEGDADALTLVTRRAPAARGFGVRIDSAPARSAVRKRLSTRRSPIRATAGVVTLTWR
jgi:methylmalonyl-CoA mutase